MHIYLGLCGNQTSKQQLDSFPFYYLGKWKERDQRLQNKGFCSP